jgi:clan AA aspartic protease (TIGR02281 family)
MKTIVVTTAVLLTAGVIPAHAGVTVRCDIVDNRNNALHWDYAIYNHGDNASQITFTKNGNQISGGSGLWSVLYDNVNKSVTLVYIDDPRYRIAYANKYASNAGAAALYIGQAVLGRGRCAVQSASYAPPPPPVQTYDPPIQASAPAPDPQGAVQLLSDGHGTYMVDGVFNGSRTVRMVLDTGATYVSIPQEVADALMRDGTLSSGDLISTGTFTLADGSTHQEFEVRLKSISVGGVTATDVMASISPGDGAILLGQSFLRKFESWSIDNDSQQLRLGASRSAP